MKAKQPRRVLLLASLVSVGSLVVFATPAVVITAPTSASSYTTTVPQLTLAGTAVGATAVTRVGWSCETCSPAGGSATLESSAHGNWHFQIDRLRIGPNTIVVMAESADGRTAVDEIVVAYAPSDRGSPIVSIATAAARDHRVTSGVAALTGICSDNVGCTEIEWSNGAGDGGTCTNAREWSCAGLVLRPGVNVLTITGRDAAGNAGAATVSVTYDEPLAITTAAMAPAAVNRPYRPQHLTADGGGGGGYRWTIGPGASAAGPACAGLSISADGVVSGQPTATGTCEFLARVTDSSGRSATKPLTIRVSDAEPEGPHDYFESLKVLPEVYPIDECRASVPADQGACSLRNQDQLDRLSNAPGPNLNPNGFVYRYGSDAADGELHDAAKLEVTPCPNGCTADSGSIPTNQVINMPLDFLNTGTILFVWDAWFGPEWRSASCGGHIGPQNNMKTFQVRGGSFDRGQIYFETRHRFLSAPSCDDFAAHDNRVYPADSGQNFPNGVTDDAPFAPTGKNAQPPNSYPLKHSTWTRYVAYLELTKSGGEETFADWRTTYLGAAPTIATRERVPASDEVPHPDTWHAFTMWICDEGRDCARVLWRVPWKLQNDRGVRRNVSEFDFQFNTSARANLRTGNVTAYVRNWVALRNYPLNMRGSDSRADIDNNPAILKKPMR